jgi:hypothetical protein
MSVHETEKLNKLRESLRRSWPAPLVSRAEAPKFSGGLVASGTLANADCAGTGPERLKVGRRTAYLRDSLIEWLLKRCREA